MKCIIQPLYNFLKMCNSCIAITINLFLPMSRWCLEVVGISKHLVWCCIFGKCQNLGGSNEMYYAATIQFSKNVQFVHCNYHKFIFANEDKWCLEVVGISKHLVWCHIFGKCQNLGGSNEMYYAATIQFSKNVQFVHCNYHKFIFTKEQMLFGGCRNFKTSSLVSYFWKMSKFRWKHEMYYAATIQFSKNVQFVHCNYHKFIFANE